MDLKNTVLWKDKKHHLWFPISFTKYSIENDRLMITEGFLSTTINETLLYRIVDLTLHRTLAHRIFGTGDIIIKAKVDASPEIVLKNISKPLKVRSLISQQALDRFGPRARSSSVPATIGETISREREHPWPRRRCRQR